MKLILDTNEIGNPNILGEILRDQFFDQSEGLGCYRSFKKNPGVERIGSIEIDPYGEKPICQVYKLEDVYMFYTWVYGDGDLFFITNLKADVNVDSPKVIENDDCKYRCNWKMVDENGPLGFVEAEEYIDKIKRLENEI